MKKAVGVFVLIGLLFVGVTSAAAETYKLGMLPHIAWSEFYVAREKGFWDKQGVAVELLEYLAPMDHFRARSQGRFKFGPGFLAALPSVRDKGVTDQAFLGTLSVADHHKLLVLKQDLVNKSLAGQTIGFVNLDVSNKFMLNAYLETVNTRLADIRVVEMSPADLEANFRSGRLQAVMTIDQGNKFYESANGVLVLSTHEFYEPHGFTARKSDIAATPPEDLKKILRGVVDAAIWIRDPANWNEYQAILKKYLLAGRADMPEAQMREFAQGAKFLDPQTLLEHNQQQLQDYFVKLRAFLAAEGVVKPEVLETFTYEDVIQNQLLIEVLQEYVK